MQNRSSRGSSNNSMNNTRAPSRGALVDPQTYGMLLWQSKLQEKLLEEQKEKRQRDLEDQKQRIRERQVHRAHHPQPNSSRGDRAQNQNAAPTPSNTEAASPVLEIPPQMFPGPAPYTISQPTPQTPTVSPHVQSNNNNGNNGSPPFSENLPNGPIIPTTTSSPAGLLEQQPMFPDIPTNRIRTSVSCDNFGKSSQTQLLPTRLMGNIVSFQQLGGAGSPRRSPSGKLLTALRGDPEIRYHQKDTRGFDQTMRYLMDRDKVQEYKRELDRQLEEKRKWRSRMGSGAIKEITRKGFIENGVNGGSCNKTNTFAVSDHHLLDYRHQHQQEEHQINSAAYFVAGNGGGGRGSKSGTELAPLMRKFNSLPKLTGLSSTDVTRPYVHSPRNEFFHPLQPNEVAETLSSQLKEKEWLSRRQRENERLATERHFQTWDSLWGRPGGGAPLSLPQKSLSHAISFGNLHSIASPQQLGQSHAFNRTNLFKALHMSHQQLNKPK